jgi:hypothetical protein
LDTRIENFCRSISYLKQLTTYAKRGKLPVCPVSAVTGKALSG